MTIRGVDMPDKWQAQPWKACGSCAIIPGRWRLRHRQGTAIVSIMPSARQQAFLSTEAHQALIFASLG